MPGTPPSPPYFQRLLSRLADNDPNIAAAFGRHVHWGLWSDPQCAEISASAFGQAAEALCEQVLEFAEIRPGQRILDVGCGFGGALAQLNERYSRLRLIGLNIDTEQLQRARLVVEPQAGNETYFVAGDAAAMPLADGSVDRAIALESVFHFDRSRFFAETKRVLHRQGTLTLSDFVPHSRAAPYLEAIDLASNDAIRSAYGDIDISWSIDRYRELASAHGLRLHDNRDITEQTLPTYEFLRILADSGSQENDNQDFQRATALLEKASRRGLLGYQLLRFAHH